MSTWPFGNLRPLKYGVILADPPWRFQNFSAAGELKNPVTHYECMGLDAIKALPISQLAGPDCAMIMWATAPMLPQAIETMAAWGFVFKSAGAPTREHSRKPDEMRAICETL